MAELTLKEKQFSNDDIQRISDVDIENKIGTVRNNYSELVQINNYIVRKHLKKIDREGTIDVLRAAFPSFLLLVFSLFIDVANVPVLGKVANNFAEKVFPGTTLTNQKVEPIEFWWLPFAAYIIFVLFAYFSNRSLKKQISLKGPSDDIISRIIESYSGLVDSISTAMPLLGAAILLISIKEGPTIFLGFSVPFEVKSIMILAIGKLFNSVFETQALQFQAVTEEVNNFEKEYSFYNQDRSQVILVESIKQANEGLVSSLAASGGIKGMTREEAEQIFKFIKLSHGINEEFTRNVLAIKNAVSELRNIKVFDSELINQLNSTMNTLTTVAAIIHKSSEHSSTLRDNMNAVQAISREISNIKLPDEKNLTELQNTAKMLSETINSFKDSNAIKGLDNLVYLAGKR
jgi:hypothetical protein